MKKPIAVGYDGSEASDLAVIWAAEAAVGYGLPLNITTAWTLPTTEMGIGTSGAFDNQLVAALRDEAHAILDKGVQLANDTTPDISIRGQIASGPAAGVLVDESETATMVVLGTHGKGALAGLFLGSVSRQVATHIECPAVVVRAPHDPESREIVVGVDGSESSLRALRFAFEEASRRALTLRVLHTWEVPPIGAITGVPTFAPPEILEDLANAESRITAEELAGHREDFPDVEVITDVVHGSPVKALKDASESAAMVVVGSRGRGGFTGLLLGSVSHAVVHQAECSVAVVR